MLEYTLKVFVSLLQVVLQKVVVSVGPPQNLQVRLACRLFRSFSFHSKHAFRSTSAGNRWYISDPKEAVRYFEDDEIDERKGLYNIFTEIREQVSSKKMSYVILLECLRQKQGFWKCENPSTISHCLCFNIIRSCVIKTVGN
jgi:hypothetical protein